MSAVPSGDAGQVDQDRPGYGALAGGRARHWDVRPGLTARDAAGLRLVGEPHAVRTSRCAIPAPMVSGMDTRDMSEDAAEVGGRAHAVQGRRRAVGASPITGPSS